MEGPTAPGEKRRGPPFLHECSPKRETLQVPQGQPSMVLATQLFMHL